jgi:hypothetical protein
MKRLGVFIVFICLLMQTFSKGVILLEFLLNRDYIARNLCVNKSRPKLKCNGTCQLMKELAAREDQERNKEAGSAVRVHFSDASFTDQLFSLQTANLSVEPLKHFNRYIEKTYPSPHFSLFHPPGA